MGIASPAPPPLPHTSSGSPRPSASEQASTAASTAASGSAAMVAPIASCDRRRYACTPSSNIPDPRSGVSDLAEPVRLVDHHPAARRPGPEPDLHQPAQRLAHRRLPVRLGEHDHEAATAGAQQLAADG